jgi:ligand-binding sensor domain-containing protein
MFPVLWIVGLLVCANAAWALDPGKSPTQYSHRIWGREEGLLQPSIYSIVQSREGYLWLGTQDGLIRFDGIRFRDFTDGGGTPFRKTLVRAIAEDSRQNLWIGAIGAGLAMADSDGHLTRFSTTNGFPSNDVFCVVPNSDGSIWACTGAGLVELRGSHQRVFTSVDGLPENRVRSTCEGSNGTRWVAGADFGLSRSKPGFAGSEFTPFPGIPEAADSQITALYCAAGGDVWAGTHSGLYRIRGDSVDRFTSAEGLADNDVLSLAESDDGIFWIGSRLGVSRYRNGEISAYSTADGLSHSSVLSLLLDREGSLWAGTQTGLDQFTDAPVTPYTRREGLPGNDTSAVVEDAGGTLWVGTLSEGLGRFDGKSFASITSRNGLASDRVLSLARDLSGDIWVGTDRGISRIRAGRVVQTFRQGIGRTETRSIFVDADGTIWAGTERGLLRYNGRTFETAAALSGEVVALGGGSQTRLFVSAAREGFFRLAGGKLIPASQIDPRRTVRSYYAERERHVVWMGTLGRGLIRWEDGKTVYYRVGDGLYDGSIYSILRDREKNFWFASAKGIFRVAESELNLFAEGKIHTIQSVPFSTGQFRFECQEMAQPAAVQSPDGRMWFSTTSGLVAVDPDRIPRNRIPPSVRIESAWVNGERIERLADARLKPWQESLDIRYTALSFVRPEKVSFRYMLEGYDRNWTDAGTRREAIFTNLPPGKYRFKVIAENADGVASRDAGLIAFTIEPYFYQRAWFFWLMGALAGMTLWLMWYWRGVGLKREFSVVLGERARIARDLHDTLIQQLSGVMMRLQALWTQLPLSREKTVLGDIIRDAEACAIEARSSLWELRSGAAERDFATSLRETACKLTRGKPVELEFAIEGVDGLTGRAVEYQLVRIAGEAISNAVRHSGASTLRVACTVRDGELELSIRDNGNGFAAGTEPFGHFGLTGIRERAREIGADVNIESNASGTTIRVSVVVSTQGGERSRLAIA